MTRSAFLVNHTVRRASTVDDNTWDEALSRERDIARDRISAGIVSAIWRVPGESANWAIWHADSEAELRRLLNTLPLAPWSTFTIHPLEDHPLMITERA